MSPVNLNGVLNVWGGGQLLAFSGCDGKTNYQNGLVLRTSFSACGFDIKLPGAGKITFPIPVPAPAEILLGGDFFRFGSDAVKGAFLDAHHLLLEGDCRVELEDDKLASLRNGNKTLVGTKTFFTPSLITQDLDPILKARAAWIAGMPLPFNLPEARRKTLYKALSQMKTQVYSPEGVIPHYWTTPDRWPHRQMWLWDSVFHAIGLRHLDIGLARQAILALFDTQKPDGMIAHMMNPSSASNLTQPPVIALGVQLLHETAPSPELIAELYPKLKKYLEWDLANRDTDGAGLCEWMVEGDVNCRCGESGLDNSSRFDCATRLDATDFNAYLAQECEIMAGFAKISGNDSDVALWQGRHEKLCRLINERLWSEEQGFYFDYNLRDRALSGIYAVSGFLPLICGAPSKAQAAKLVAHLTNPDTFGTPFRVPSVAKCHHDVYSKDMWRGPVWISTNWLIIRGLKRYGFLAEAAALAAETMDEVEKMYMKHGTFFEFYDDRQEVDPPQLLRKGKCAPEISPYHQAFFDYGWTATLYLDLAWSDAGA